MPAWTFRPGNPFRVPDQTIVYPLLNAKDVSQPALPWHALDGCSVALGDIPPHTHSMIHVHPIVSQAIFVLAGDLNIRVKAVEDAAPRDVALWSLEGVLLSPGTFLQLRNDSASRVKVAYLVSPPYAFEPGEDPAKPVFDDAVTAGRSWDDLASSGWKIPGLKSLKDFTTRRKSCLDRLEKASNGRNAS